jgi:hypothetical protein
MSRRALRQSEKPLSPDVLRLVEGIALTLAQEHHAMENAGKGLSKGASLRFDPDGSCQQEAKP